MDEKVFLIDGASIISLYSDDLLTLPGLTVQHVERASNVEFDDALHGWIVTLSDGRRLCAEAMSDLSAAALRDEAKYVTFPTNLPVELCCVFPARQAALDAEIAFLNRKLVQS